MNTYNLIAGDSLHVLPTLPDNHFDSIVTDPPYGISFMGQAWDHGVPSVAIWRECLRVLKPGGYLLSFAGTRTYHRMAVNIEDAGFEVRDMIGWMYGSGFPKSHNISKAIDRMAGAEREVVGTRTTGIGTGKGSTAIMGDSENRDITAPATPAAIQWDGWGTALKPSFEPICMARKPLSESTVAANVLKWGTGGINVDGCRVETEGARNNGSKPLADGYQKNEIYGKRLPTEKQDYGVGRFPANLITDGSDEVLTGFPETGGGKRSEGVRKRDKGWGNSSPGDGVYAIDNFGDSGSAARFFYCAKASKQDRDAGCDDMESVESKRTHSGGADTRGRPVPVNKNTHPTVKPTDLMRYLCRLVTPPNGHTLDPFCGSGSTGRGAMLEGFDFTGIDLDAHNIAISEARINEALTTARNKAGDFTPTAKEKQSGQMNIFDMMPAPIKLRGLTADEYDETFGGDAMKR